MAHTLSSNTEAPRKAGNFLTRLGPGLITGAADDDPSGVATYSQAGAQFGFGLFAAFKGASRLFFQFRAPATA